MVFFEVRWAFELMASWFDREEMWLGFEESYFEEISRTRCYCDTLEGEWCDEIADLAAYWLDLLAMTSKGSAIGVERYVA